MLWGIGDVHGMIPSYEKICKYIDKVDPDAITVQVGDMGIGFDSRPTPVVGSNHFFINGNHDNPAECVNIPNYLKDFGIKEVKGHRFFYICGAQSTDKEYRTENVDWWEAEQLPYDRLCEAVALYEKEKPDIVISHDCPMTPRQSMFGYRDGGRTAQALETMFNIHQPKVWAFGHHHRQKQETVCGTRFMCFGELQHKQIRAEVTDEQPVE